MEAGIPYTILNARSAPSNTVTNAEAMGPEQIYEGEGGLLRVNELGSIESQGAEDRISCKDSHQDEGVEQMSEAFRPAKL